MAVRTCKTWLALMRVALLIALLAAPLVGCSELQPGPGGSPPDVEEISFDELPAEAQDTLALIDSGGPFPYEKDGSVFHNYEGLLPPHGDGYYREYTVETPGSPDRGARRIVEGAEGERYYTDDHYMSFRRIVE